MAFRRVAGECGLGVMHTLVVVFHAVDSGVDIELPAVVAHLVRVVTKADEEVAEGLVIAHVFLFLVLQHRHAMAAPEADLVELDSFEIRAAEQHRAHRTIADWQGFSHPLLGGLVVPEA